jgi:hypothetical protein
MLLLRHFAAPLCFLGRNGEISTKKKRRRGGNPLYFRELSSGNPTNCTPEWTFLDGREAEDLQRRCTWSPSRVHTCRALRGDQQEEEKKPIEWMFFLTLKISKTP